MLDAGCWMLEGRDLSPPGQGGIKGGVFSRYGIRDS